MPVIEGLEHLRLIGGGGFADVFAAHEPAFSRDVAVKVFRSRVGDADRDSFEREAQAMGRLSGIRNVVQVYRSGITEDQHPFLVMELMRGSMQDRLLEGPVPVGDVCAVGVLIGRALAEAHARGILHRDIKPANVLIDRYGEPALSDFGISSLPGAGASASIGAFTAEHAPPEVFEDARTVAASDVYSFASTLCTLMDGHPPFARSDDEGPLTFMQRVKDTPCPTSLAAVDALARARSRAALGDGQGTRRPTGAGRRGGGARAVRLGQRRGDTPARRDPAGDHPHQRPRDGAAADGPTARTARTPPTARTAHRRHVGARC